MRSWWENIVKDYLTFSRKERRGIFLGIFLGVAIYLFSNYLPANKSHIDPGAFQKELTRLKITIDSNRHPYLNPTERSQHYTFDRGRNENIGKRELFAFDPNTLDPTGWKRLGVKDKTILTIQHFIAKGYKFRQPDDLRKIYGLPRRDADLLVPFVRIAEKEPLVETRAGSGRIGYEKKEGNEKKTIGTIDVNRADTSEFISLPGIGSKLAARIVNFRKKLGGFSSVEQVAETYGIPDSTFQTIKGRLECLNPALTKININTASASELKEHPYIRWNVANAIVNYRTQHGNYNSLEDLRKIEIISTELFNKIAPYLVL